VAAVKAGGKAGRGKTKAAKGAPATALPGAAAAGRGSAAAGARAGDAGRRGGGGGGATNGPPVIKSRTLLKTLVSRSVASSDTCASLIANGVVLVDGVVETDGRRKVPADAQLVVRGVRVKAVVGDLDRDAPRAGRPGGEADAAADGVRLPRVRRDLSGNDWKLPTEGRADKGGRRGVKLDKKYTWKVDGGFYAGRRRAADK